MDPHEALAELAVLKAEVEQLQQIVTVNAQTLEAVAGQMRWLLAKQADTREVLAEKSQAIDQLTDVLHKLIVIDQQHIDSSEAWKYQ